MARPSQRHRLWPGLKSLCERLEDFVWEGHHVHRVIHRQSAGMGNPGKLAASHLGRGGVRACGPTLGGISTGPAVSCWVTALPVLRWRISLNQRSCGIMYSGSMVDIGKAVDPNGLTANQLYVLTSNWRPGKILGSRQMAQGPMSLIARTAGFIGLSIHTNSAPSADTCIGKLSLNAPRTGKFTGLPDCVRFDWDDVSVFQGPEGHQLLFCTAQYCALLYFGFGLHRLYSESQWESM